MINDKKARVEFSTILLVLLLAGAAIYLALTFQVSSTHNLVEINMYDVNGKLIATTNTFAVVNNVPNVAYITVTVNVQNTGTVPLDVTLSGLSPTEFDAALTKTVKTIQPGQTGTWTSNEISANQFIGGTQPRTFRVTATGVNAQLSSSPTATGSINLNFQSDATGGLTVTIGSGSTTGSGSGGTVTPPTTTCGNSVCEALETSSSCPSDCTIGGGTGTSNFETNAVSSNYKKVGVWIKVDGVQYNFETYITGGCNTAWTKVATTPEGYDVRKNQATSGTMKMKYYVCIPGSVAVQFV